MANDYYLDGICTSLEKVAKNIDSLYFSNETEAIAKNLAEINGTLKIIAGALQTLCVITSRELSKTDD